MKGVNYYDIVFDIDYYSDDSTYIMRLHRRIDAGGLYIGVF